MRLPGRCPTTSRHALADKLSRARGRATANYGFYLGVDPDRLDEALALPAGQACGLTACVGGAASSRVVDDPRILARLVEDSPLLLSLHGEYGELVETRRRAILEAHDGELSPGEHAAIHSPEAGLAALDRAAEVLSRSQRRIHVADLGSLAETERLAALGDRGGALSAAVTLPSLYFVDADYAFLGNRIKNLPPIRGEADRRALRRGLAEDRIDMIASGHTPQLLRDKGASYSGAAAGMPVIQFALPVAWCLVAARTLTPEQLAAKIAHNPARRFGLVDRGFLREGYWADLTLIDAGRRCEVDRQPGLSQCGWSPFAGRKLPASVAATWVNGALVWREGLLTGQVPGMPLEPGPNPKPT